MNVDVLDATGKKVGQVELDPSVFGVEVKEYLLWEVVKAQLADRRAGTHSTKKPSEVRGGGKKPWKQKGTGRARQGSIRSAQWVGGGKIFTPRPRSYGYVVPKKVTKGALRSALSLRARDQQLIVLESFDLKDAKTKLVAQVLKKLGAEKALIVDRTENLKLNRASKNLASAKYVPAEGVNVYDILRYDRLILTRPALEAVTSRLSGSASKRAAAKSGGEATAAQGKARTKTEDKTTRSRA